MKGRKASSRKSTKNRGKRKLKTVDLAKEELPLSGGSNSSKEQTASSTEEHVPASVLDSISQGQPQHNTTEQSTAPSSDHIEDQGIAQSDDQLPCGLKRRSCAFLEHENRSKRQHVKDMTSKCREDQGVVPLNSNHIPSDMKHNLYPVSKPHNSSACRSENEQVKDMAPQYTDNHKPIQMDDNQLLSEMNHHFCKSQHVKHTPPEYRKNQRIEQTDGNQALGEIKQSFCPSPEQQDSRYKYQQDKGIGLEYREDQETIQTNGNQSLCGTKASLCASPDKQDIRCRNQQVESMARSHRENQGTIDMDDHLVYRDTQMRLHASSVRPKPTKIDQSWKIRQSVRNNTPLTFSWWTRKVPKSIEY